MGRREQRRRVTELAARLDAETAATRQATRALRAAVMRPLESPLSLLASLAGTAALIRLFPKFGGPAMVSVAGLLSRAGPLFRSDRSRRGCAPQAADRERADKPEQL